jgi:predicted small metal-binding protein
MPAAEKCDQVIASHTTSGPASQGQKELPMPHIHVSKRISCGAIVPNCEWTATAETEHALIAKVVAHAADAHGVSQITPELAAQVKAAIKDV